MEKVASIKNCQKKSSSFKNCQHQLWHLLLPIKTISPTNHNKLTVSQIFAQIGVNMTLHVIRSPDSTSQGCLPTCQPTNSSSSSASSQGSLLKLKATKCKGIYRLISWSNCRFMNIFLFSPLSIYYPETTFNLLLEALPSNASRNFYWTAFQIAVTFGYHVQKTVLVSSACRKLLIRYNVH